MEGPTERHSKRHTYIEVSKYPMQAVNWSKPVVRHVGATGKVLPQEAVGTAHSQSGVQRLLLYSSAQHSYQNLILKRVEEQMFLY